MDKKLSHILDSKEAVSIPQTKPCASQRHAVDAAFLSRLMSPATSDAIAYLLQTFSRAAKAGDDEYAKYVKKQAVAYAALAFLQPGSFSQSASAVPASYASQTLLDIIKADGSSNLQMPSGFLAALVAHMAEMELPGYPTPGGALLVLFASHPESVLPLLMKETLKTNIVERFGPCMTAMLELLQNKQLAAVLANSPYWLSLAPSAHSLEHGTILGPIFRLSCLPETSTDPATGRSVAVRHPVGQMCFADCTRRAKSEVDIAVENVRVQLHASQAQVHNIVKGMLKDANLQDKVFTWISATLKHNEIRTREGYQFGFLMARSSSNGFLFNLLSVLLKLAKPFFNPDDAKALKIDGTWLLSGKRLDLSKETRVASSEEEVTAWMDVRNHARIQQFKAQQAEREAAGGAAMQTEGAEEEEEIKISESFGTISEIFFLTLRTLHVLGPSRVVKDLHKLSQDLHERHAELQGSAEMSEQREQIEAQLGLLLERRLCYDVVLSDVTLLEDMLLYARLTARWLLRLAQAPASIMPLPPPSKLFKLLPEFAVETVVDTIKLVAQTHPSVLETVAVPVLHDYLNFFMAFSSSLGHIKNPYLRGKLLEVMSMMIPRDNSQGFEFGGGNLTQLFQEHDVSRKCLIPTLIQFYVDIEVTGAHNQFYEKFHYRHYMAQLLLYVCQFPVYLKAVEKESEKTEEFVRFVNMMLNDAIYFIDESLLKLTEIRKLQTEMADQAEWQKKPEEERTAAEQRLQQNGGQARWGMVSSTEVLSMMKMLTGHILNPFMRPELADRVAAMLNYVLMLIAGPKCIELKVNDPDKYAFKPKELLALVVEIFINLSQHPNFAPAVIRDGRSYDQKVLAKVHRLLRNHGLKDEQYIQKFWDFCQTLKGLESDQMELDAQLGEVPDEFLDPVSCELMRDPVLLPTSNNIMDRSTISRHLLSDETDPFNRQRLTPDMLQPAVELKAKIDEFLASAKKGAAAAAGAMEVDQ